MLTVENLTVSFGASERRLDIIRGISFQVKKGGALGIIGESGSGKSIAVRSLMRLVQRPATQVHADRMELDHVDLQSLTQEEMTEVRGKQIALIFQDSISSLNPLLTVGYQLCEILRTKAGLGSRAARSAAADLLTSVGIPDAAARLGAFPHEFSGGMRQRVMIAIALALRPQVLLADEPTTALDVTIQAQIIDLLRDIQQKTEMALVLITHDLAVASELVDDVAVMYAGRIVESGPLEEVFAKPLHPYTQALLMSVPDLQRHSRRLDAIPGAPPSPSRMPSGCAFHPRCSFATEECQISPPPVYAVGEARTTACLHWQDLAA